MTASSGTSPFADRSEPTIAMAGPDRAVQAYFYNRSVPTGTPSSDRWPTG